ncbi:hypothetical protein PBI_SUPERFRESH_27 [Microbacterium phage Superfresh]|uniref:Uncharacterized protein n=7 Tax=Ilzatvirus teagan TaxID=2845595 RepID=A0A6B9LPU3_9CAUD|nr:hypothetical protein PBI_PEEP_27 [Microbacterium phage Peep]AUX83303.1 hypothetical protein PBI_SUPERFRESH_27 [Microbacterium phage Superfresh]AVO24418.1 hypothetical protein PBI_ADLER_27 [Microbacterium phage AlexAdler]AVR56229.1 hypothetical protein PBI_DAVE_27 [Microbacterium phage Dave]AVR56507.1 hypothetical protein PBI_ROBINSON_27 [Microbacterium phage Robinson]AVR56632.1 hypothetical protein PBI_ANTOINETTE_27 [Microbacterium phage Antoinette]QHB47830.1 hypothetical protein SEA_RENZI
MVTRYVNQVGASQNIGQGFGSCYSSPVLWDRQRNSAYGEYVLYQVRDISLASGAQWWRAKFRIGICNAAGVEYSASETYKYWGSWTPWVQLTGAWYLGNFRLRTQVPEVLKNSAGEIYSCQWGSWTIGLSYANDGV